MSSNWGFRLKRTKDLLKVLIKSKMAITGIIILAMYGFFAIGAPLLTPYDPQSTIVSGSLDPPGWFTNLAEGSRLSQNFALEPTAGFASNPFLGSGAWNCTCPSQVKAEFDPQTSSSGSGGSIRVSADTSSSQPNTTYSFSIEKTFDWPYDGAPDRFIGSLAVLAPDANATQPVTFAVYVKNLRTKQSYTLTDQIRGSSNANWGNYPITNATTWIRASGIDSRQPTESTLLHSQYPAQLLFSARGEYAFGIAGTMTSARASSKPLHVFIDEVNLQLYGTAWGKLGTDYIGRDIFTQLVYGARISLLVGLLSAAVGIGVGLVVGLAAGYMGKYVDEVLMRFTDMLLVIPTLPLLIILVAVTGGRSTIPILILIIGFLGWMGFARVVRSQVLTLKERPFVEAAKAAGAGTGHITTKHIIPNIVGLIYVNLALAVPGAILSEAALSFLGLGDPSVISWGQMLNQVEENSAQQAWWWILPPGLSIALVSLSFVMIGFALDSIFNPRLRQRR